MALTVTPALERVLRETTPGPNGCIIWTGALLKSGGYGQVNISGTVHRVHRLAYELMVGPIPKGLHLDHTCHNRDASCLGGACFHRRCLNPAHLDPVDSGENSRRSPHTNHSKTHCAAGHPFNEVNTYIRPDNGGRQCLACRKGRVTQRRRASGAPTRDERWAAARERRRPIEDAVVALYERLGRRPSEPEVVQLLVEIDSPFTTRGFANKLRRELERERAELRRLLDATAKRQHGRR